MGLAISLESIIITIEKGASLMNKQKETEMKHKVMFVVLFCFSVSCLATTGFATQWYSYTINGDDVANAYKGTDGLHVAEFSINDINGDRTPPAVTDVMWSNLGSTSDKWEAGMKNNNSEPAWWTKTDDYLNGLVPNEQNNIDFTFILGLSDDFTNWYQGQTGILQFNIGIAMVSDKPASTCSSSSNPNCSGNNQIESIIGTDIELAGEPVPEPATMLLFGVGLAGVAGFGRRKKQEKE